MHHFRVINTEISASISVKMILTFVRVSALEAEEHPPKRTEKKRRFRLLVGRNAATKVDTEFYNEFQSAGICQHAHLKTDTWDIITE